MGALRNPAVRDAAPRSAFPRHALHQASPDCYNGSEHPAGRRPGAYTIPALPVIAAACRADAADSRWSAAIRRQRSAAPGSSPHTAISPSASARCPGIGKRAGLARIIPAHQARLRSCEEARSDPRV